MVEAEIRQIMEILVDWAFMIKHEIQLEDKALKPCELSDIKLFDESFYPIDLIDRLSIEAVCLELPVVVFVKASVPSLDQASILLDFQVDFPLLLKNLEIFFRKSSWIYVIFISRSTVEPSISFSHSVIISPDVFILIWHIVILFVPFVLLTFRKLHKSNKC